MAGVAAAAVFAPFQIEEQATAKMCLRSKEKNRRNVKPKCSKNSNIN